MEPTDSIWLKNRGAEIMLITKKFMEKRTAQEANLLPFFNTSLKDLMCGESW